MKRSKRAVLGGVLPLLLSGVLATACSGAATGSRAGTNASPRAASTTLPAASCAANRAAGTITFVSPFQFDASAGILDVFAAQSLGYFADECLKVAFVTNSYAAVQLVSAGTGTVTGEGSAADALLAIAHHSNIVGVATFGDTSDYAILTQPKVKTLKELEGKILGYHAPMPVVLTEMLQNAGVDISKVTEVNDTSYDPTLLIRGKFQGLQAYQSNEPITLRADHDAFNEFLPSQFGVTATFNVQVFNRSFLEKHRSAAADFMRAELHAYDYCTVHVASCIAIEAAASKAAGIVYDTAHETAEWKFETALVAAHTLPGKGVGVESAAEWAPETNAIVKAGLATRSSIPADAEDTALVASLYRGTTLIWPGS